MILLIKDAFETIGMFPLDPNNAFACLFQDTIFFNYQKRPKERKIDTLRNLQSQVSDLKNEINGL